MQRCGDAHSYSNILSQFLRHYRDSFLTLAGVLHLVMEWNVMPCDFCFKSVNNSLPCLVYAGIKLI